jgi:hypothetical protein
VQLLKIFPAFYGTRRFITVFTRGLRWSLAFATLIQSIPSQLISLRSILILSTHLRLCLPSGLFPSGFHTNIIYTFLFSPIRAACPAHLILLDLIILIMLGGSTSYEAPHSLYCLFLLYCLYSLYLYMFIVLVLLFLYLFMSIVLFVLCCVMS